MPRREDAQALLPPFTPSLRYFAAVFDSLHECLPAHSAERLAIERNHLGMEISDAMASFFSCVDADGVDDVTSERDGMLFSRNILRNRVLLVVFFDSCDLSMP